jgi:hypothetical protein
MNSPKQTNGKRVFAMTILVYQPCGAQKFIGAKSEDR